MEPASLHLPSSTPPRRAPLQGWARFWSACRILFAVLISAGCASLSSQEPVSPEMLVGRWTAVSPFPSDPNGPDRLLVIDSVTQRGSEWTIAARWSSPTKDRGPYGVNAKLEVVGRQPHLSFLTAAVTGPAVSVDLWLINSRWLGGTFHGRQIQFQKEPVRAERPTYALGDKWIRNDGVYDLIRIEKDLYIFASAGGGEIRLTKDLAVARAQNAHGFHEFVPPPQYTWPLEVGKWGISTLTWRNAWDPDQRVTLTWKVEAYEEVYTTAGRFKAFRIVQKLTNDNRTFERQLITWYAPEARQIVKIEGHPWFGSFQIVALDRPSSEPKPPAINVESPADQATLSEPEIVLATKVTSGKGVAGLTLTLNGEEVQQWEWDLPSTPLLEKRFDVPVTLKEGKNLILVTARDRDGASRQEARTLFYERPTPQASATGGTAPSAAPPPTSPSAPAKPTASEPATVAPTPPAVAAPPPTAARPHAGPPAPRRPGVCGGKPAAPPGPRTRPPWS